MGECGCEACRRARLDYLHGGTASPDEREEFARRDRRRRVPNLRDLEDEVEQAEIDQRNLERIKYGWTLVDKKAMTPKTRLMAWLLPADVTGIDRQDVEPGLIADGYIDGAGDLTGTGRDLILGSHSD